MKKLIRMLKKNPPYLELLANEIIQKTRNCITFGAPNKEEDLTRTNGWSLSSSSTLGIDDFNWESALQKIGIEPQYVVQAQKAAESYFLRNASCTGHSYLGLYFAACSKLLRPRTTVRMVGFNNIPTPSIPVSHHFLEITYQNQVVYCDPWRGKITLKKDFNFYEYANQANHIQEAFIHCIKSTFSDVPLPILNHTHINPKDMPEDLTQYEDAVTCENKQALIQIAQLLFSIETYFLYPNLYPLNKIENLDILMSALPHLQSKTENGKLFLKRLQQLKDNPDRISTISFAPNEEIKSRNKPRPIK